MTTNESTDFSRSARPPWLPATVSWCAVATAVVLAVSGGDSATTPLIGWLAGSVVTVACAIAHRLWDRRRRQKPGYTHGRLAGPAVTLALAVGFVVGFWHAWVLAWFLTQWSDVFGGAT